MKSDDFIETIKWVMVLIYILMCYPGLVQSIMEPVPLKTWILVVISVGQVVIFQVNVGVQTDQLQLRPSQLDLIITT